MFSNICTDIYEIWSWLAFQQLLVSELATRGRLWDNCVQPVWWLFFWGGVYMGCYKDLQIEYPLLFWPRTKGLAWPSVTSHITSFVCASNHAFTTWLLFQVASCSGAIKVTTRLLCQTNNAVKHKTRSASWNTLMSDSSRCLHGSFFYTWVVAFSWISPKHVPCLCSLFPTWGKSFIK